MEVFDNQTSYSALQLIPQRPRFQSAAGQLAVHQLSSRANCPKSKQLQSNKQYKGSTESLCATKRIQEKYNLNEGANDNCDTDAETQRRSTNVSVVQRQGTLQHLARFKKQAAAIRSTALAVQEWFDQQQGDHAEPLPADALQVLNKEADKGLLHLLSTGLIPVRLELSPGLCDGPDAVLQSKAANLLPAEQKHTATSSLYMAPKPPPPAAAASSATVLKQQNLSDTVTTLSQSVTALPPRSAAAQAAEVPRALALAEQTAAAGAATVAAAQPRGYEALLDDLSEHQLLIYNGKLVQETPQVLSFLRLAVPRWAIVSVVLSQLEAVCRLFKAPLAVVDGKAVLLLAADAATQSSAGAAPKIGLPDLLCCLANLDELEALFQAGGEIMEKAMAASDAGAVLAAAGTAEMVEAVAADKPSTAESLQQCENDAAAKKRVSQTANPQQEQQLREAVIVPACDAGSDALKAGQQSSKEASSTSAPSAACTVHRLQQPFLDSMYQARRSRDAKFQHLQQLLRQHWHQLKQQPHMVLHLPSMACIQQQQLGSGALTARPSQQQHQLWRVLDLFQHLPGRNRCSGPGNSMQNSTGRVATLVAAPDQAVSSSCSSEICTTADVVVTVVVDRPVCKPAQTNWMQLLKDAGVQEPERHIRFVVAAAGPHMPAGLPLSASLLSSSKALDRCRRISIAHTHSSSITATTQQSQPQPPLPQQAATRVVAGSKKHEWNCCTRCPSAGLALPRDAGCQQPVQTPHAVQEPALPGYIVPGYPGEHDLDVAVKLGLPLLGPTPQLAQVLASRIGCRSLFAAAGMRVPPGGVLPHSSSNSSSRQVDDTASWQSLLMAMCLQLLHWPQQQTWMLKLNNASGTTGLAVLDLQDMPGAQAAVQVAVQRLQLQHLQQQEQQCQQYEPLDFTTVQADMLQQELQQMAAELAQELHIGLLLVQPQHWQQQAAAMPAADEGASSNAGVLAAAAYCEALRQQGGVMEALLDNITCCPLVQLLIEPTGTVNVLATQDKILHGGFSSPGSTFPSSCPTAAALAEAAQAAGNAAYTAGMLGYIQVSFICTRSSPAASQQQAQEGQQEQQLRQQQGNHQSGVREVHLWGCDVTPWATADLALFRVFDTVAQGRFDAATGSYVVTESGSLQQPDVGSLSTGQEQQQQRRHEMHQLLPKETADKVQVGKCSGTGRVCSYASLHNLDAVLSAEQCASLANFSLVMGDWQGKQLQPGAITQQSSDLISDKFAGGFGQGLKLLIPLESVGGMRSRVASFLQARCDGEHVKAVGSDVDEGEVASAVACAVVCCSNSSTLHALQQLSVLIQQLEHGSL